MTLGLLMSVGAGVQAACPSVSCSGGDVSFVFGTFGCTLITTAPSGQVTVGILEYSFDGAGDTSLVQTTNSNAPSGTTFMPWTPEADGSYCINDDDTTGYIMPGTGCPVAFVVTVLGNEIRLLDTTQNLASTAVCESIFVQ